MPTVVVAAVEGDVDEAVVRQLIRHVGAQPGPIHGKRGKRALRASIGGYNNAARHQPWFVLADLDREADCAPPVVRGWLPNPATRLCLRFAVRQVEAWLMADAESLAAFLRVAKSRLPRRPEELVDAKVELVNLARCSRRRDIRVDMVPREGSGRTVGPAYTSRLIEYVESRWRPGIAAVRSDSLRRAVACLEQLAILGP